MPSINWFEIPAYDIYRATTFYNAILHAQMETTQNGEHMMAFFPQQGTPSGALVAGPGCVPSEMGALVYLNAGTDLDGIVSRIEPAGGRLIMPRTFISEESGSFALFIDSEGNRLAVHEAPVQVARVSLKGGPNKRAAKPSGKKSKARKAS